MEVNIDFEVDQMDQSAVPLILIHDEDPQHGKVHFELQNEGLAVLNTARSKKVQPSTQLVVAAVAGPQRTGKSFLANRLLRRNTGFKVGPSTVPCTRGIWVWGKPIDLDKDTALIILDTEGLNSVRKRHYAERDVNVDLKIFSLSVLLSSIFIYNCLGNIDEKTIESMSCVLKVSEGIRMKEPNESEEDIANCFPIMYWVLRDFVLDLKGQSEKYDSQRSDYLEDCLTSSNQNHHDPKNQIRTKIKRLFRRRRCYCFPRPIEDESKLADIENIDYKELKEKFRFLYRYRTKMDNFQRIFYDNLVVKEFNGRPLSGEMYIGMLREYVKAINGGNIPEVLTSLERVIEGESRKMVESLSNTYKEAMNKLTKDRIVDDQVLEANHKDFLTRIEEKIKEKMKGWQEIGRAKEHREALLKALEEEYQERVKANARLNESQCNMEFTQLWQGLKLPEIVSVRDMPETLIKDKFAEFRRKAQSYFDNCRAPRKCSPQDIVTFFAEKLPKALFDYMELLVARIKGTASHEIERLEAQLQNATTQAQSRRRMLNDQDELTAQQKKEIEAMRKQMTMVKNELSKVQQLRDLDQQTDDMSKKELKAAVEEYKAEVITLEQVLRLTQRIEELSKMARVGPGEASTMATESTEIDTRKIKLGGVISSFEILTQTVDQIKAYFQKHVLEYEPDEDTTRQIENLRSEKHRSLVEAREESIRRQKQHQAQLQKMNAQAEQTISTLNKFIDSLKAQNVDLARKLSQAPSNDMKLRQFLNERKQFEESLRLKQNSLQLQLNLNQERALRIEQLEKDNKAKDEIMAVMKAEQSAFESFKETLMYVLRESLHWVTNKPNKLKHSIRSLSAADTNAVKKIFKDLGLNPF